MSPEERLVVLEALLERVRANAAERPVRSPSMLPSSEPLEEVAVMSDEVTADAGVAEAGEAVVYTSFEEPAPREVVTSSAEARHVAPGGPSRPLVRFETSFEEEPTATGNPDEIEALVLAEAAAAERHALDATADLDDDEPRTLAPRAVAMHEPPAVEAPLPLERFAHPEPVEHAAFVGTELEVEPATLPPPAPVAPTSHSVRPSVAPIELDEEELVGSTHPPALATPSAAPPAGESVAFDSEDVIELDEAELASLPPGDFAEAAVDPYGDSEPPRTLMQPAPEIPLAPPAPDLGGAFDSSHEPRVGSDEEGLASSESVASSGDLASGRLSLPEPEVRAAPASPAASGIRRSMSPPLDLRPEDLDLGPEPETLPPGPPSAPLAAQPLSSPSLAEPPAFVAPPPMVEPPAFVAPPPMVEPPAFVAPPPMVEPPPVIEPPPVVEPPPVFMEPPPVVEPPAFVAPPAFVEPPLQVAVAPSVRPEPPAEPEAEPTSASIVEPPPVVALADAGEPENGRPPMVEPPPPAFVSTEFVQRALEPVVPEAPPSERPASRSPSSPPSEPALGQPPAGVDESSADDEDVNRSSSRPIPSEPRPPVALVEPATSSIPPFEPAFGEPSLPPPEGPREPSRSIVPEEDEVVPASQRQPREDRPIDDHLEGVQTDEPPPESGEVESQRQPAQSRAPGAERVSDAPALLRAGSEGFDLAEPDVVERPAASVREVGASFEGARPAAARSFGELLDLALDL